MMVLRSMLFVPGNSMRMITKAPTLPADAIIFDLEDAVPLPDKETARILVRDSIKAVKAAGAYIFVRINALTTGLTAEDLKFIVVEGLDGVMLSKAESRSDVVELAGMLETAEKDRKLETGSVKIIPLFETAKGIVNVYEITSASERVVAVTFGAGDYYRDMGRSVSLLSPEQTELLYARSQVVVGSRAAGVQALDTVYFGLLTDREAFTREALLALQLGFKGKELIHPNQIEITNRIFAPSPEEAESARKVVEAFEEAQKKGLGAVSFEGKMIDYMNYVQAKDLVSFVELIAEKEKKRQKASSLGLSRFFASTP
ncbi:HpcH/HpaI aldolase/citrate lyase family protein [Chloroflexota bacterium]